MRWADIGKAGFTLYVAFAATFATIRALESYGVPYGPAGALATPVLVGALMVMIKGFGAKP